MAIFQNLQIVPVNGYTSQPGDTNKVTVNIFENITTNTVVGKIANFAAGEDPTKLIFTVNTAPGSAGNDGGRYGIKQAEADGNGYSKGDWVVYIADGGPVNFNWEDMGSFMNKIKYDVTGAAGYTPKASYGCAFTFNVQDVNEGPTGLTIAGSSAPHVNEKSAGAIIGALDSFDEDDDYNLGEQAAKTYSVIAGGDKFTVTADGKLKLLAGVALDWATAPKSDAIGKYYEVTIRATDSGGYDGNGNPTGMGSASSDTVVKIYVDKVASGNTNPVIDGITASTNGATGVGAEAGKILVQENAGAGIIAAVAAHDDDVGDTITYALGNTYSGLFSIDAAGKIKIADASKLPVTADADYTLTVNLSDGHGGTATQNITIRVKNVNQNPIFDGISADTNGTAGTGAETGKILVQETAGAGVIAAVAAHDDDRDTITYALGNTYGGLFSIDAAGKIKIADASKLPVAADTDYTLTVNLSDGHGGTATQNITIRIKDVAPTNHNPVIDGISATTNGTAGTGAEAGKILVQETAGAGIVAEVTAHDDDRDTITYALGNTYGGLFSIDAAGKIKIADASKLPVTADTDYTLTVNISDGHGGTAAQNVTIRIKNVDALNNAPVIDGISASTNGTAGTGAETGKILVQETAGVGIVAAVTAHDDDRDTITYALGNTYGGLFSIDAAGKIKIADASKLPVTADTDYTLTVNIGDGHGGTASQNITIRIKDVAVSNAAPTVTVTGSTTTAAVDDGPAVSPFTGVTFGDNENDDLTVTISFAAADGDLILPVGVTATSAITAGTKTYTFTGKADILSLALKNVKFDPIDRAAAAGTKFTTDFIIGVKDGSHAPVTNSQIKVESTVSDHTVANDAPTMVVSGPTLFTTTDNGASVSAFAGLTFGDTENNDLTLKVSFADGDGALEIPAGATVTSTVSGGVKTYTFTGKADVLTLVMDNVKFNPTDNPFGAAGSVKSTHFNISLSDVSHVDAPVTNSAISVDTVIANRAPLLAGLSNMVAQELAAADTVVGTLAATDSNAGDALTYSLVGDGAGGRFKLVGNQILVADGFKLDFEQAQSHQIQVQVRDKAGATSTQTLTINVGDVRVEKTAGSVFNDVFKGGKYNDALGGGLGNDVLWGGLGKDTLTGGKGKDTFVFDTKLGKANVDKIMDYSVKEDTIWLDNALFKSNKALYNTIKKGTEAKPAKLASKFFTVGDKAKDKDDFFIYDSKKLVLYYDADGDGGKAAVQIATFKNNKLLKNFTYKELLFI
ncbi:cadherin domain-containing protein [Microvirga sp. 2TAF3]|uniref:beta strand repeat-containing protein n=1 Tax=Microvirga sp. 2TAF3 TaxID=3233014 RepID=UPI003F961A66